MKYDSSQNSKKRIKFQYRMGLTSSAILSGMLIYNMIRNGNYNELESVGKNLLGICSVGLVGGYGYYVGKKMINDIDNEI